MKRWRLRMHPGYGEQRHLKPDADVKRDTIRRERRAGKELVKEKVQ